MNPDPLKTLHDRTKQLEKLLSSNVHPHPPSSPASTITSHYSPNTNHNNNNNSNQTLGSGNVPSPVSPNPLATLATNVEISAETLRAMIFEEHAAIEEKIKDLNYSDTRALSEALSKRITALEARHVDTTQLRALASQVDMLCANHRRETQARIDTDTVFQRQLADHHREWRQKEKALMERIEGTLRSYRVEISGVSTQQQWAAEELEKTSDPSSIPSSADDIVSALQNELRRRSEEADVLRLAIMNDRLERENSSVQAQRENAAIHSQLEELRKGHQLLRQELELQRHESRKALDNIGECAKLQDLYGTVVEDLRRVKTEQHTVLHSLEELTRFVEMETNQRKDETKRVQSSLDHLGIAVQDMSQRATLAIEENAKRRSKKKGTFVNPDALGNFGRLDEDGDEDGEVGGPATFADEYRVNEAMLHHERRMRIQLIQTPFVFFLMDALAKQRSESSSPHRKLLPKAQQQNAETQEPALYDPVMSPDPPPRSATTTTPKQPTNPNVAAANVFMASLVDFYSTHNPSKIASIPAIMREYDGARDELIGALEAQYDAFGFFESREMLLANPNFMLRHDEALSILNHQKGNFTTLLKQLRSQAQLASLSPRSGNSRASSLSMVSGGGGVGGGSQVPPSLTTLPEKQKLILQHDMADIRSSAAKVISLF
eukprot:PhF_6_TR18905/c0_g1_i1/m.27593